MKKTGILGGTFNPVHTEHIMLAVNAVKELNLDKLIVMPTFISPHKNSVPASCTHRLNMLKLAFSDYPEIEVSDFEIKKEGKSYTYETVEHFNKLNDGELYFICGGDMLTDFKNWRYPERILSACTLAVFDREDFFTDYDKIREYFKGKFNKDFVKLDYVGKDASSTKIRIYSKFNLPLDNLTDKRVADYIKKNDLYAGNEYNRFICSHLIPKRIRHTANVTITALRKAKELNLDLEKVEISATLHDVAKYMDYRKVEGFVLPDDVPAPVIHSFLGAYVAEHILKITDEEILDAIRYHTSGKANMTTLSKLIFVADMVEEDRDYEGVEHLRSLYEHSDFEMCFKECLKEEVQHLINKGNYIYSKTLEAYDYYINNKKEG